MRPPRAARSLLVVAAFAALVQITDGRSDAQAGPPCEPPADGRLAWWPADESFVDRVSGDALPNTSVTFTAGAVGSGFAFDGASHLFTNPYTPGVLDPGAGSFSVSGWIRTNSLAAQAIINRYDCGGHNDCTGKEAFWFVFVAGGIITLDTRDVHSNRVEVAGTTFVADGEFHHFTVVRDVAADQLRIYVDGRLDGVTSPLVSPSGVRQGSITSVGAPVLIGARSLAATSRLDHYFTGAIDELAYHGRALTDEEIAQRASLCAASATCMAPPAGMVAWWRAEQNARDSATYFHGTPLNGAAFLPGKVGSAFSFDGADDYVDVPPDLELLGLRQGTLEMWARIESLQTDPVRLFGIARDGAPFPLSEQWALDYRSDGSLEVSLTRGGVIELGTFTPVGSIRDSHWHHIVVVSDGVGSVEIYIDGVSQRLTDGFVAGAGPDRFFGDAAGANTIRIGAIRRDVLEAEGVKQIDEVTIYNRPLLAEEIRSLFAAGAEGKCAFNRPPTIAELSGTFSSEGDSVLLSVLADDPDGDVLQFSASGLPAGLSIDTATGSISGTLAVGSTGDFAVTVGVSDGTLDASRSFIWHVRSANVAPGVVNPGNQTTAAATPVSLTISASDADSDTLTFRATGLPLDLTIDAAGVISGRPRISAVGAHHVVVFVDDGHQHETEVRFEWTIDPAPPAVVDVVEIISVMDTPGLLRSAMFTVTEAITVADSVLPLPSAQIAIGETITVGDVPHVSNTPVGSNISVTATNTTPGTPDVSAVFSSVVTEGSTTVATKSDAPPLPSDVKLAAGASIVDVSTTAIFSGHISLAFSFANLAFDNPAAVQILHYESGAWVNATTAVDTAAKIVYGTVQSLSPFAIVEPVGLAGEVRGEGHIDGSVRTHFIFRIADQPIASEQGTLTLWTTPRRGTAVVVNRFASTSVTPITIVGSGAWFSGSGTWNGMAGYTFDARAIARMKDGRGDSLAIVIRDAAGQVVATHQGNLAGGNLHFRR